MIVAKIIKKAFRSGSFERIVPGTESSGLNRSKLTKHSLNLRIFVTIAPDWNEKGEEKPAEMEMPCPSGRLAFATENSKLQKENDAYLAFINSLKRPLKGCHKLVQRPGQ